MQAVNMYLKSGYFLQRLRRAISLAKELVKLGYEGLEKHTFVLL